jgi:uncharacterized protein
MINKRLIVKTFFIFILAGAGNLLGQKDSQEVRKFVIGNSEIRGVTSKITNQEYELIVAFPYSYESNKTKKYPVVYFCDGYWDFTLMTAIYGSQIYDKRMVECFLVGFSYKGQNIDYGPLRFHDYTPARDSFMNAGGGAGEFLKVVEKEFIPFVEKNYRVDSSWRALAGCSAGGTFVLYTLFSKPSLFNAYIAVSPAVTWGKDWLFGYEEKFSLTHKTLPVSLFMSASEKEMAEYPPFVKGIRRFDETLKKRNYGNFRYGFRFLDDTYHSSSKPEGYTRGMQFTFEPMVNKK